MSNGTIIVLSLGEQQRLTFARLLLNQPKYAILDEATSALDLGNEERLYHHLQAKGTTFLSVGHRSTLTNYHQSLLELSQDKTWQIKELKISFTLLLFTDKQSLKSLLFSPLPGWERGRGRGGKCHNNRLNSAISGA
ncbi:ATP-binding cassette domain-containing protein [Coleofasciculus sp. F4-SAH-05]|uniref:ATP-binding cassette domain-containing protein n=1 Tax=Coleofasciculus sp. F4-SAH-05 TaxID=3069525 RepID=UPI0033028E28